MKNRAITIFLLGILLLNGCTNNKGVENGENSGAQAASTYSSVEDETTIDSSSVEATESGSFNSEKGVKVDESTFPDAGFRDYISESVDTNNDGLLSVEEIENVTTIFLRANKDERYSNLTSLKGVEIFSELSELSIMGCGVKELDLSGNRKLTYLQCSDTEITNIDVSIFPELRNLQIAGTLIDSIDVSHNFELHTLDVSNTNIEELELSNNKELTQLYCNNCEKISSLDLNTNSHIQEISIAGTGINSLDVTEFSEIITVTCDMDDEIIGCDERKILRREKRKATKDQTFHWDHYKSQLSKEDSEVFNEYISVLDDESKFFCFDWCDQEHTFSGYLDSIMAGDDPDIEGIALVDMDGKNGKELIIHFNDGGGNYLILTRDGSKFYGINLGERWFEELQNDGKYLASGGAGDWYLYTMSIDRNGVKTNQFGELHGKEDKDGNISDHLVVDGKDIEDAKAWLDQNYSDPVKWIE